MEKILVTGGAGYIGSILVPELLTKGYHVTVIDNFMFKQASLNNACSNKNLAIINGDIRDRDLIKKSLSSADIVIPLASLVGAPLCSKDPYTAKAVNHDAIMMMLDLLSKNQIIIMPTTNSAYGTGDENNYCTEDSPLRPISQYAIEKVEIERGTMVFSHCLVTYLEKRLRRLSTQKLLLKNNSTKKEAGSSFTF